MDMLVITAFLSVVAVQDSPKLPPGTPAEQVAAIQARLDAARAEYIRKFEKATTTFEVNKGGGLNISAATVQLVGRPALSGMLRK